ncbi:MAG TPA: TonB-dependent receptor [Bacteroidales bacterium]|nr:TonB-dependent receptor [Bacteroidales bacterium]
MNSKSLSKSIVFLAVLLFGSSIVYSQNKSIRGVIIDGQTKETLIGALVKVVGTQLGATTDVDGKFIINNVTAEKCNLQISYISYLTKTVEKVEVKSVDFLTIELQSDNINVEEIVITGVKRTNTESSLINSIRTTDLVINGISSEQIKKSQDRDASDVVKRVSGITIQDNRFVIVRGLNQRYNSVWLNGAAAPSSETDVKSFSFDIIPGSMIDNLLIYKNNAPELPADFAGGFVSIFTQNMPDKNSLSISYSTSVTPGTTFTDFLQYQGGKMDWAGFDDGTRALPVGFPNNLKSITNKNLLAEYGRKLNSNWVTNQSIALPDQRLGVNFTRKFSVNHLKFGTSTAISYSNTSKNTDIKTLDYQVYDFINDLSVKNFDFVDEQYAKSAKISVIHNWALLINSTNKIEFRNLFNQNGTSKTTIREGYEYTNGEYIRSYEMGYMSRSTYMGQLAGSHGFGKSKIDWNIGYAYANRLEPDLKRIESSRNEEIDSPNYGQFQAAIDYFVSPYYTGRLYTKNIEHLWSAALNFERELNLGSIKPVLKAGFYGETKDREFSARNLGYKRGSYNFDQNILYKPMAELFNAENINENTGFILDEDSKKSNVYQASNNLAASYAAIKLNFATKFNLYTGVRAEYNIQQLEGHDAGDKPVSIENAKLNFFPSVNLSYSLNKTNLLRIAYGKSINRPEFREIAPYNYFDFETNAGYSGNPDVKDAQIHSFDFRYEVYPNAGENFSIGLFYKNFINPIELRFKETGSGLAYTYQNAEGARSVGAELELRKSLVDVRYLQHFNVVINASVISSQIYFNEQSIERDRTMQGQSPYIVNTGLFYQNEEKGLMMSLLYNIIGPRIYKVGAVKQKIEEDIPNVYEMPRHSLDFTLSKKYNKFEIKGGIVNLLNQEVVFRQLVKFSNDTQKRVQNTKVYNTGRYFSLGVTFNI